MFVHVRLLNGFSKSLLYQWPDTLPNPRVGTVVHVPIRTATARAIVIGINYEHFLEHNFKIKSVLSCLLFPDDPLYYPFITKLAHYYSTDPIQLIHLPMDAQRIRKSITSRTTYTAHGSDTLPQLTSEQQHVASFMLKALESPTFCPTLLHGVTGSGKTEIYKHLAHAAIKQNNTVILLLPEVTLALRITDIMRQQLPASITVHSFHCQTTMHEKRALWHRITHHEPTLIIGVHMPIMLPIAHLGLIIIDEEHEVGYQEKKHPKINSKDAALMRAHMLNIPILLGSATPSIASLYNVKKRGWHFFQLTQRFAGAFATVSTVLLSEHKEQRRNFWISKELERGIADCLARREQAIIFINRRGYSFFVQCTACNTVINCSNCSVSLTLHDNNILACHYCGLHMAQPTLCPECRYADKPFAKKGIGTQQVVTIIQKLFPRARIGRADMDTTSKKKVWQETLHNFQQGTLDILVGTQTIAKGFHFPNVTLVGIVWADLNLHFPVYNASETCLQQLIQVAGRAGRQHHNSRVIVQTMTDHPIFAYINEIDYLRFYTNEIAARTTTGYPPIKRLVEVELKHTDETIVEQEAHQVAAYLRTTLPSNSSTILGPARPPVHMIQKIHFRKIYIKTDTLEHVLTVCNQLTSATTSPYTSSIFFTPNPTA